MRSVQNVSTRPKVIAILVGGIGNQLFCYAAARRLALFNNAELVLDEVSGFARDHVYNRQFQLDHFKIPCRRATASERLEPFSRIRHACLRYISQKKTFFKRSYIRQEGRDFDPRLLQIKIKGKTFLEGYWQSEGYFKDVETTIRQDLEIVPPGDDVNRRMAEQISSSCNAVAVHVRYFDNPDDSSATHNLEKAYYHKAAREILKRVGNPHFFLFSDQPAAARQIMMLPENQVTCVDHNRGDENAYADLWLMTKCHYFIIANSTFSWWGAWLGDTGSKIIIAPSLVLPGAKTAWGFPGLLPARWNRL
jgi:hypothetical protein